MKKNECAGVLGWLFGHRYMMRMGGWVYSHDACYRCGKARNL